MLLPLVLPSEVAATVLTITIGAGVLLLALWCLVSQARAVLQLVSAGHVPERVTSAPLVWCKAGPCGSPTGLLADVGTARAALPATVQRAADTEMLEAAEHGRAGDGASLTVVGATPYLSAGRGPGTPIESARLLSASV
jgi:hypothetical protein